MNELLRIADEIANDETFSWNHRAGIAARIRALASAEPVTDQVARLSATLERDRSAITDGLNRLQAVMGSHVALCDDGRNGREWDDDAYRNDFGQAYDELREAIDALRRVAGDLIDCPIGLDAVMACRQDGRLKRPWPEKDEPYATPQPRVVDEALLDRMANLLMSMPCRCNQGVTRLCGRCVVLIDYSKHREAALNGE